MFCSLTRGPEARLTVYDEVIEDHIRMHLINPALHPGAEAANAAEELIEVVRSYLK